MRVRWLRLGAFTAAPRPAAVAVRAGLAAVVLAVTLTGCTDESDGPRCVTTNEGVLRCGPDRRGAPVELTGDLLDGGGFDLASLRGRVVVVNFWGSWCAPCRAETDDLEQVYQDTKTQGVAFLGINIRDDRDKARAFLAGRVNYPSLFDPSSKLALRFDPPPNATPATIVLDRQGRIARVIRTAVHKDALAPIVAEVVAENGSV